MSLLCACPKAAAISDIPYPACIEDIGQIQKFLFQRKYVTDTTLNILTILTIGEEPEKLATWTTLLAIADGSRVVQSPFIQNPEFTPGEMRGYGGNTNATVGGQVRNIGRNFTTFTGEIHSVRQDTIEALKDYECENTVVYFIDENGRMWGLGDDITAGTPTTYRGIPIVGLFISDKKAGGLENPDMNMLSFQLEPNWSDKLHAIVPEDFDAKNDLITP